MKMSLWLKKTKNDGHGRQPLGLAAFSVAVTCVHIASEMYEGQEVPPPPNIARRRRYDHPHGQVIDPLAAEVVVLDSDKDM
jgi:hypothetical protein